MRAVGKVNLNLRNQGQPAAVNVLALFDARPAHAARIIAHAKPCAQGIFTLVKRIGDIEGKVLVAAGVRSDKNAVKPYRRQLICCAEVKDNSVLYKPLWQREFSTVCLKQYR